MASSRRTGGSKWTGHDELQQALDGLASPKGTSAKRIKAVVTVAMQHSKEYKRVVHDVEMFVWKSSSEHRLAGLYAMDAIIRHTSSSKKDMKDVFAKRFGLHLSHTIAAIRKIPMENQSNVEHVLHEWQARGIYTSKEIEEAGGNEYILKETISNSYGGILGNGPPGSSEKISPTTASAGKLASLLSIIKKQKEMKEVEEQQRSDSGGGVVPPTIGQSGAPNYTNNNSQSNYSTGILGIPQPDQRYRPRPDQSYEYPNSDLHDAYQDNYKSWDNDDIRPQKKARGSRWGPPKGPDDRSPTRPNSIDTSKGHSPPTNFVSQYSPHHNESSPYNQEVIPLSQPQTSNWPHHYGNAPQYHGQDNGQPLQGMRQSPQDMAQSRNFGQDGNPAAYSGQLLPGGKLPHSSGELCRKFLTGRCAFGDMCWHVHDAEAARTPRARIEIMESRRKTMLCQNFPNGTCRFGDKCSFAHGESELVELPRRQRVVPMSSYPPYDEQKSTRVNPNIPIMGSNGPQVEGINYNESANLGNINGQVVGNLIGHGNSNQTVLLPHGGQEQYVPPSHTIPKPSPVPPSGPNIVSNQEAVPITGVPQSQAPQFLSDTVKSNASAPEETEAISVPQFSLEYDDEE